MISRGGSGGGGRDGDKGKSGIGSGIGSGSEAGEGRVKTGTSSVAYAKLISWVHRALVGDPKWICLLTGPAGCGKTHSLDYLESTVPTVEWTRLTTDSFDWKLYQSFTYSRRPRSRCLVVDDVTEFPRVLQQIVQFTLSQSSSSSASSRMFVASVASLDTHEKREHASGVPTDGVEGGDAHGGSKKRHLYQTRRRKKKKKKNNKKKKTWPLGVDGASEERDGTEPIVDLVEEHEDKNERGDPERENDESKEEKEEEGPPISTSDRASRMRQLRRMMYGGGDGEGDSDTKSGQVSSGGSAAPSRRKWKMVTTTETSSSSADAIRHMVPCILVVPVEEQDTIRRKFHYTICQWVEMDAPSEHVARQILYRQVDDLLRSTQSMPKMPKQLTVSLEDLRDRERLLGLDWNDLWSSTGNLSLLLELARFHLASDTDFSTGRSPLTRVRVPLLEGTDRQTRTMIEDWFRMPQEQLPSDYVSRFLTWLSDRGAIEPELDETHKQDIVAEVESKLRGKKKEPRLALVLLIRHPHHHHPRGLGGGARSTCDGGGGRGSTDSATYRLRHPPRMTRPLVERPLSVYDFVLSLCRGHGSAFATTSWVHGEETDVQLRIDAGADTWMSDLHSQLLVPGVTCPPISFSVLCPTPQKKVLDRSEAISLAWFVDIATSLSEMDALQMNWSEMDVYNDWVSHRLQLQMASHEPGSDVSFSSSTFSSSSSSYVPSPSRGSLTSSATDIHHHPFPASWAEWKSRFRSVSTLAPSKAYSYAPRRHVSDVWTHVLPCHKMQRLERHMVRGDPSFWKTLSSAASFREGSRSTTMTPLVYPLVYEQGKGDIRCVMDTCPEEARRVASYVPRRVGEASSYFKPCTIIGGRNPSAKAAFRRTEDVPPLRQRAVMRENINENEVPRDPMISPDLPAQAATSSSTMTATSDSLESLDDALGTLPF